MTDRETVKGIFGNELSSFESPEAGIADFTMAVLMVLPDYFLQPKPNGGDNKNVLHTRISLAFANTRFMMDVYREQFSVLERDIIRSALLLHDGMIYGNGTGPSILHEHPLLMKEQILNEYWEKFLPLFIREDIAKAVETHSGQWNVSKDGKITLRKPETDVERFVHECVFLASRKETTTRMPGMEAFYAEQYAGSGLSFEAASAIAKHMVEGNRWDYELYQDAQGYFICLNGQNIRVAAELRDAFVTIGKAAKAQRHVLSGYSWNEFCAMFPRWDRQFYGTKGALFVRVDGRDYPVSDQQAADFGVVFN